ncbi:MAG TPA: hypothetical protein VNT79_00820 [Phycisphaerae bacterium]|nr:hypothetical protein [Phycisphaerae bacterium]
MTATLLTALTGLLLLLLAGLRVAALLLIRAILVFALILILIVHGLLHGIATQEHQRAAVDCVAMSGIGRQPIRITGDSRA